MDYESVVTEPLPAGKVGPDDREFVRGYSPKLTDNDRALAEAIKKKEPFIIGGDPDK